jgi:hypothetical protein
VPTMDTATSNIPPDAIAAGGEVSISSRAGHRHRRWPWRAGLAAAGMVAGLIVHGRTAGTPKGDRSAAGRASRPVPVLGAPAVTGDVGVFQTGLGTATAVNTVTVRTRVDGRSSTIPS